MLQISPLCSGIITLYGCIIFAMHLGFCHCPLSYISSREVGLQLTVGRLSRTFYMHAEYVAIVVSR